MATVEQNAAGVPEPIEVRLDDLITRDASGTLCITEATLDDIWPPDDREPLVVVGKGFKLPPTCVGEFVPCEEKYGREQCIKFVFDGPDIPQVPLPQSGFTLLVALGLLVLYQRLSA